MAVRVLFVQKEITSKRRADNGSCKTVFLYQT